MFDTLKRIYHLLSLSKKKRSFLLLILLLIAMVLEMLGMGLILPVLSIMINPDALKNSSIIKNDYINLSDCTQVQLITIAMILIIVVYIIKSIFFLILNNIQSKFIFGISKDLSNRLFKGYLYLPYSFHLKFNSAHLLRNLQSEVIQFTYTTQAVMNLVTELLLSCAVSAFLFFVEPQGTVIVFLILTISALFIFRFTKNKLARLGIDRLHHEGECSRHLMQGLNGIKEVKVLGKQDSFFNRFASHNEFRAAIAADQYAIQNFPRIFLEFFSILGLAILVFSILFFSQSLERLIPILGVFAAASFRLLPSVNRIVGAAQLLKFTQSAVDTLDDEIRLIDTNFSASSNGGQKVNLADSIQINNLTFTYPDTASPALDNVNFTIPKGTSIGIIGESGSGKSTLINIILGLFEPSSGSVKIDRTNIQDNMRGWQDQVGYVPQFIYLTDDSIKNNVAFGEAEIDIDLEALVDALRVVNLMPFINEHEKGIECEIGERGENLSGGQRQRLGIARAIYPNPSVIILDEATSSLDIETEKIVMSSIDSLKGTKTIVIVAHRLSTVENCDWIIRLDKGKIVEQGIPTDILKQGISINATI
jgi:ABC-type multidrug transport system fused ATPase/permease subunit